MPTAPHGQFAHAIDLLEVRSNAGVPLLRISLSAKIMAPEENPGLTE